MIGFLTNVAPIMLGFVGKLFAMKSQAATDNQKLMMEQFAAKGASIDSARAAADKESPMAAWNRRVIILVILALIIFTQVAPPLMGISTVVPTVTEGFSLLGITFVPDVIEYITVEAGAVLKLDEVFGWATMIIEFYFGSQIAKR